MVSSERRLAAILAGDVVGYSKLVHSDEDEALARVKRTFEMVDTVVKLRGGRIVKTMGDGFIAEFASVVAAFEAARAIFENLKNSDENELTMRMGLHVGDIVFQADGDILGNGVNIAARLESFAQPGNIAVSGRAADELLRRKITFFNHGQHQLKNIDEPVEIYEYGEIPDDVKAKAVSRENGDDTAARAKIKAYVRQASDEPKTKKSSSGRFVGLFLVVLVAAGVAAAGWYFNRSTFEAEKEIAAIPCSWLRVEGHNEVGGQDVWSISGYSVYTAEQLNQDLIQKAIDQGASNFDLRVGEIVPIERSECNWIGKLRRFAYLGIPRIAVRQVNDIQDDGGGLLKDKENITSYVLSIDLSLFKRKFFVYAIDPSGAITYGGDQNSLEAEGDCRKSNLLECTIRADHTGSSALIVLESDNQPPKGLVENQVKTMSDIQAFYDVGQKDHWSINLVQFVAAGRGPDLSAGVIQAESAPVVGQ